LTIESSSFDGLSIGTPGTATIAGVPEGYDSLVMGLLIEMSVDSPVIYVLSDDSRLAKAKTCLSFFNQNIKIIEIPAWDCLPYDRVSPRHDLASKRMSSLISISGELSDNVVILITVNALLQRVPSREILSTKSFSLKTGSDLDTQKLFSYLECNGFDRVGTVMQIGEYAVRGGIIDIFAPGRLEPVRLDLFSETIESIRQFDPITQRSNGKIENIQLVPVSEVTLDSDTIKSFCSGYRTEFGAVTRTDALFESVKSGRRYPGMEHWLPLFYGSLETIFDYLPRAPIIFDELSEESFNNRLESIDDYYTARCEKQTGAFSEDKYNPLSPEKLYIIRNELDHVLASRCVAYFSPFAMEATSDRQVFNLGGRLGRIFAVERDKVAENLFNAVKTYILQELKKKQAVVIACWSLGARERLRRLLKEHGLRDTRFIDIWDSNNQDLNSSVNMAVLPLERGFVVQGISVIAEQDILGDRLNRGQRRRKIKTDQMLVNTSELSQGDLVVHLDHGIARYKGLVTLEVDGAPHDFLSLFYEGDDRLLLPVENIELLSRYGSTENVVPLDRLGGVAWQARKAKLKKRIQKMAEALMDVAAKRMLKSAPILRADKIIFEEFCAKFPYLETEDQANAIDDTIADLEKNRPMDRLICGDVGFGKTEVALRAAFTTVMSGKQVAILVPTTLLCRQHFHNFLGRFKHLPVRVEQLSRLVQPSKMLAIRNDIRSGAVDIAIGTQALLSKTIQFFDLGLIIIDEEQHFGVAHKEHLKRLRAEAHVLTLTATPIPRTLQMALTGVKDMSVIATPPVDRLAIRTFIMPFDPIVIRDAILREYLRGGQSFYVCPRVADLSKIAVRLSSLVPEVKVKIAHGAMPVKELESVMADFYDGAFDVLVSTAIVESGLDLQRVNTIIIHRADLFGLSQLYQLRGRIGRSKVRGYAYFLLPPSHRITSTARRRLEVIHRLDSLGAGFSLASHDMDIRGAGNLLGGEQSGHIKEVGIELYQHMLNEAVTKIRRSAELAEEHSSEASDESKNSDWSPNVSLGAAVLIPENYVQDLDVRLALYRRIALLERREDIDDFVLEMTDRFGKPPEEFGNLLDTVAIKYQCRILGVARVDAGPKGAVLVFRDTTLVDPVGLIQLVNNSRNRFRLQPDNKLVAHHDWPLPRQRLNGVRRILSELEETLLK